MTVTFLTKPERTATLDNFWKRVHGVEESGAYKLGKLSQEGNLKHLAACWGFALLLTYSILFLVGKFLLQEYGTGAALLGLAAVSWYFLRYFMEQAGLFDPPKEPFLAGILDDKGQQTTVVEDAVEEAADDAETPATKPKDQLGNDDFPDLE